MGRLAAATGFTKKTLQRRLDDPEQFRLAEIEKIATALEVTPGAVLAKWLEASDEAVAP